MVQPQNVTYKIVPYNDSDNVDEFIPSEVDKLINLRKSLNNGSSSSPNQEELPKDKKCVIVELSLPASSYATMALREIMVHQNDNDNKDSSVSGSDSCHSSQSSGGNLNESGRKRPAENEDKVDEAEVGVKKKKENND